MVKLSRKQSRNNSRKSRKTKKQEIIGTSKCVVKNTYENPIVSIDKKNGVTIIVVKKMMSDSQISNCEADYFDNNHYKHTINSDTDCYRIDENGDKILLAKFRKRVIPDHLSKLGMKNLKKAAMQKHDNRGASAGKIDVSKMPKYANNPKLFHGKSKFRILGYYSKITGKFVNNSLGNQSKSNIIGYFDKRDRNLGVGAPPCRTTAFTSQQYEKYKETIPLIKAIDRQFKKLIPDRHKIKHEQAHKTPKFVIADTSFSTVTINYNWRTALHKDAGDLKEGYGNLVVLEEGKYKGGETGFPQYGVCVDVRQGDFLAMDVHEWHCNTKLVPISKDYTRLSMVAYLRENMIRCNKL